MQVQLSDIWCYRESTFWCIENILQKILAGAGEDAAAAINVANNIVNGANPAGGGGGGGGGDVGEVGALAGVVGACRPLSHNLSSGKKMANTGDLWLQWFSCCFHHRSGATVNGAGGGSGAGKASSRHRSHQRLRRIDRSMIGNPTNFVHTAHIGSGDVEMSSNHLNALQVQMQSKGGYEMNSIQLQVMVIFSTLLSHFGNQ